jgi:hypothetical protein
VLYILVIFKLPALGQTIGEAFGIEKFNNFVIEFKSTLDRVSTDVPTKEEVVDSYERAMSGAKDLKESIVDGVDTTKETIDTVRETLS